jgi:hypothetical protein
MAVQIQLRNDTAANWTSNDPVLAVGEMGVETDTDLFKLGDGATAWTALGYGGVQGTAGADGSDGADGGFDTAQAIENKSTNYSLVSGDAGKLITNSAAITVTVDDVLSVGEQVDFLQNNAAQITFAAGSGVTLNSKDAKLLTNAQYSPASVKCIASGVYVLVGDLG